MKRLKMFSFHFVKNYYRYKAGLAERVFRFRVNLESSCLSFNTTVATEGHFQNDNRLRSYDSGW